jgi:fluoride exporter
MFMIHKFVLLAVAGALGTLARYGLSGFMQRICGTAFPWGTATVNLIGCFLAGFLWMLFESRWPVSGEARIIVMVGFMGGFTTFSSLILETSELLRASEWMHAFANIFFQNILGFIALRAGIGLGRLL